VICRLFEVRKLLISPKAEPHRLFDLRRQLVSVA
jgi:hypothetical protein